MKPPRLGALVFAFGSWLAACSAAVDPIAVKAGCPEMPLRGPAEFDAVLPESVIDDFEDGDLLVTRIAHRTGSWYPFPVSSPATTGVASTRCAASGLRSGHFTAVGDDAAVNWNVTMVDPFTAVIPYDASAWSGFSFWIAAGETLELPVDISVGINTTDVVDPGGVCTTCGDYPLVQGIPLTRNWTRWSFRFEDLKQKGFGVPPTALRTDRIVNFIFWPKQIDFWIDDFRFER
jgi:hypothetical protein